MLIIFFLQLTFQVVYSVEKKLFISVLLKKDSTSIELGHKKGFRLQITNTYSFPGEKSTFFPFTKNPISSPYFFIPLKQVFSLEKVIPFSKQLIESNFKNSELCIYLQENQNSFSVLVGPFTKKADAEFVSKNLTIVYPCQEIKQVGIDQTFACMQMEKKIFIMSSIVKVNQNTLVFTLSGQDQAVSWEGLTYPDDILFYLCKNQTLSVVNKTDIETYLLGVVPTEMPDHWNTEALKAQSIVSRTFVFTRSLQAKKSGSYFDVTDDTNSQVYQGKKDSVNSPGAIKSTKGMILTFKKNPIESVFHSTSGGYTENNDIIWNGSPSPYLRAVPSPGEEISPHFSWCTKFTIDDFIARLNKYLLTEKKKTITSVIDLQIIQKGESPRVRRAELRTDTGTIILPGSTLQQIFSLKSTWFDFLITNQSEQQNLPPLLHYFDKENKNKPKISNKLYVYIYGRGWGHGVGMSQYGALVQAKKGILYPEILEKFFCQTQISRLDDFMTILQPKSQINASCNLSFSPDNLKLKPGESKDLILKINTSMNVFGVSFDVTYPKEFVTIPIEEIREGTFLKSDGKNIIFQKIETASEIKVVLSREGKSSGGVSGTGDLLTVRVKSKQPGVGRIEISNLKVLDSQLNQVYSESSPCKIEISQPDLTPPKTQITNFPDRITNKKLVFFEWTGSDDTTTPPNLLYAYRMNDEPWSTFSKETSHYFSLSDGNFVFFVQSRDENGNIDTFPPSYSFSIDMTPPLINVTDYPATTNLKQVTISGTCEPGATFLINGLPVPLEKEGRFSYMANLEIGQNIIRLIAIDQASNTSTKDIKIERILKRNVIIFMTIGSTTAVVNDQNIKLDIAPIIKEGRTMVPLRFVAETFGATIKWNARDQQIDISLQTSEMKHNIVLWIGNKRALVDSKEYFLESPPITLPPGRTIVPIRFIAEALESSVEWQPLTRTIKITFPKIKSGN